MERTEVSGHSETGTTEDIVRSVAAAIVDGVVSPGRVGDVLFAAGSTLPDHPGLAVWLVANGIVIGPAEFASAPAPTPASDPPPTDFFELAERAARTLVELRRELSFVPSDLRWDDATRLTEFDRGRRPTGGFEEFLRRSRHRLLTAEDEVRLGRRVAAGDRHAADVFALHNIRLATTIARRYSYRCGPAVELEDLVQEGYLGLVRAVDGWDPTRGFKFSTYASWWIRQRICRSLDDTGRVIRLPVHLAADVRRVNAVESALASEGRDITVGELSIRTGLDDDKVDRARSVADDAVSLDALLASGAVSTDDFVADLGDGADAAVAGPEEIATLLALIARMNPRERDILLRRFGFVTGVPQTLEEVGKEYGVTRERIRQIEKKAIAKLRRAAGVSVVDLTDGLSQPADLLSYVS